MAYKAEDRPLPEELLQDPWFAMPPPPAAAAAATAAAAAAAAAAAVAPAQAQRKEVLPMAHHGQAEAGFIPAQVHQVAQSQAAPPPPLDEEEKA